ncbi:rhodanese-like domain-containing protein [Hirsutella rhossiliensis]|uniref:Sulfurtransferase n=1 Tax=Hirsutella rhossiliensis TaxID=111463 RepID=A0A9P8N069_9HYPO|nr:rhodanese-like domain-containing protein [Hirsutella rhossiliensis]KAH0964487.1 rhodanese-like domain-containing protein [Hirsutella rhossiliensis]
MTAARRALAAPPTAPALRRLLLPLRRPARQALVGIVAPAAATTRTFASPRAASPPALPRRWYSLGSSGADGAENDSPSGSRIWTFDEVKRQVEVNSRGPPSKGQQKVVFIDVREYNELAATGKIPGAVNMPLMTAAQVVEQPGNEELARQHSLQPRPQPRDAHLVFYCRAGVRARTAAQLAGRAGWPSVGEYPGSWLEWEERAGPVERVPPEPEEAAPEKRLERNRERGA